MKKPIYYKILDNSQELYRKGDEYMNNYESAFSKLDDSYIGKSLVTLCGIMGNITWRRPIYKKNIG